MVDWSLVGGSQGDGFGFDEDYLDAHAGPGPYFGRRRSDVITCRGCDMGDLRWGVTSGGKYWLRDPSTGDWHDCPARRVAPEHEPGFLGPVEDGRKLDRDARRRRRLAEVECDLRTQRAIAYRSRDREAMRRVERLEAERHALVRKLSHR